MSVCARMRLSPILGVLAAVLAMVASGSIECTPAKQAWERMMTFLGKHL